MSFYTKGKKRTGRMLPVFILCSAVLPGIGALENEGAGKMATIETNYGRIEVELFSDAAPETVENLLIGKLIEGRKAE